jgi:AcrR family transcriptional regulator
MYATNENCQAIESRKRIIDALLSLLKKYSYKDITITQICHEAQIVRQTYYRNFDVKDDIIAFHLDNMIQVYYDNYYQADDVHTQLNNFFSYMLKNRDFLFLASKNKLFYMIDEAISKHITKFICFQPSKSFAKPQYEKYVIGFIASTICSLLSLWEENRFIETPEMMSELAQRFLAGLES